MRMMEDNDTDKYTLSLDELTGKQLTVYLYEKVQNIEEIHKKLISKELPCCIVKANLVLHPFQIAVAANKAALNEKYEQMVTRSLHTEIIYCLSTSKNISQSLATFGISNNTTNILVVLTCSASEQESLEKLVFDSIKGERLPLSKLSTFSDLDLIKKNYKVDNDELKVSTLLDSVVSRISDKISK